ncbi:HNH endonuclease family protein [Rhizohabitans arisaemae]|uniref:HNH endonuclease family protein n=1 Tax=Rhizohabitans arisaemae TaxID=2720610 RepID=UPI0024B0B2A0|nr:HNH endonuclease family protein [Rhizohabitans arisaemae]
MRRVVVILAALTLSLGLIQGTAHAVPPNIPSASVAAAELAALTVAPESNQSSYDRSLFPHWITISGSCNTRETVLRRDGTGVVVNSSCYPTSGSWFSPYDGATWYAASDIDIDHLVALAEAWRSGAHAWTTAKRRSFANDLGNAQLWAVTDYVNQAKGDKDPAAWKPPLPSFWCTYARAWIDVKYEWGLTVDAAEKSELTAMLGHC